MNGFSDHIADPEIGHLYGLRWFQVTTSEHRIVKAAQDLRHTTCECSCGGKYDSALSLDDGEDFARRHHDRGEVGLRGARAPWQPGENVAHCHSYTGIMYPGWHHQVPVQECGCGFWAYWALGLQQTPGPHAVGLIKGYGNVIQGDLGFRCSHAKIEALFLPGAGNAALYLYLEDGYAAGNAALYLEDAYAPVYSTMGAMLLRHPAPPEQPRLTDDFYARRRHPTDGTVAGVLKAAAYACQQCRRMACAEDQELCAACQCGLCVRCGRGRVERPPFCPACRVHETMEASAAQTLSGKDALAQAHTRRESWVARTGPVNASGSFSASLTQAQRDLIVGIFRKRSG